MTWGLVAVAGATVVGGALSANAAKDAAGGQTAAANQAIQGQQQQNSISRADLAPARLAGNAATARIRELLGLGGAKTLPAKYGEKPLFVSIPGFQGGLPVYNPEFYNTDPNFKMAAEAFNASGRRPHDAGADEDFKALLAQYAGEEQAPGTGASVSDIMAMDPGYQFRLQEGLKSGRNIAGARGMLNSGSTAKALTRYGQDYASGEFNSIYNRLANVAVMGQGAVNTGVNAGANYAGNVGNMLTGAANARGASAIGQANAWGGALNTVGGYYGQQQTLDKILASRNQGGGGTALPYGYD